ncbi:hypothetical protein [Pseudogemmobacter bohemicus]|uniref:hypothetical protein n=1 Tax=Pseudogemmobacter bohemicus TaxID=2250708 RepID=UPI001300743F|nr:hypothetical protein [Pseudogemmobacter bohemicus]
MCRCWLETRANRPGTTETTTGQTEEIRHFLNYARRGAFPEGQENRAAIVSGTAGAGGG